MQKGYKMTTQYKIKFSGESPVLITRIFEPGLEHTLNIEYAEAEAIARAWMQVEYSQEFKRRAK